MAGMSPFDIGEQHLGHGRKNIRVLLKYWYTVKPLQSQSTKNNGHRNHIERMHFYVLLKSRTRDLCETRYNSRDLRGSRPETGTSVGIGQSQGQMWEQV